MTMNLVVPKGLVKFVFCIDKKPPFLEIQSGISDYKLITVPPSIWFGFKGLAKEESLIMNLSTIEHVPDEVDTLKRETINYKW